LTLAAAVAKPHSLLAILLTPTRHVNFRPITRSCVKSSTAVRINSMLPIYAFGRTPDQLWRSRGEHETRKDFPIFDLGLQWGVRRMDATLPVPGETVKLNLWLEES